MVKEHSADPWQDGSVVDPWSIALPRQEACKPVEDAGGRWTFVTHRLPGQGRRGCRMTMKQIMRAWLKSAKVNKNVRTLDEDAEVSDRLSAMEVAIRVQVREQLAGNPVRSSKDLLPRREHILANAARHAFRLRHPFRLLTLAEARSAQHDSREQTMTRSIGTQYDSEDIDSNRGDTSLAMGGDDSLDALDVLAMQVLATPPTQNADAKSGLSLPGRQPHVDLSGKSSCVREEWETLQMIVALRAKIDVDKKRLHDLAGNEQTSCCLLPSTRSSTTL